MNESISRDSLQRAYDPFKRDHSSKREELMRQIGEVNAPTRRAGPPTMRRRTLVSAAAAVLVAIAILQVTWFLNTSASAAIEKARECLLGVRSLHLKGWIYQTTQENGQLTVKRYPHEFYAERPNRYWRNGYGFSFAADGSLDNVTRTFTACDGERAIWVSHDQRLARVHDARQLDSELNTERFLQSQIFDRLVAGLPETYRVIGKEETQGVVCRLYEQREDPRRGFGHRRRLWLDASNGEPVRMKAWIIRPSGTEEPVYEYNMIDIDGPRPENDPFDVPDGYDVKRIERLRASSLALPNGPVASGGGQSLFVWTPLNIDDRGVLVCWWVEVPVDNDGLPQKPNFALEMPGSERHCHHIHLRTDAKWNWSLLKPNDKGPIGLDAQLSVVLKGDRAFLQFVERPLRLPKRQLERVLLGAQNATVSHDGVELFTLNDLRALIRSEPGVK